MNNLPLDVAVILSELNASGIRRLGGLSGDPPAFLDPSDDGFLSPLDAALIINYLNSGGESEPTSSFDIVDTAAIDRALEEWVLWP